MKRISTILIAAVVILSACTMSVTSAPAEEQNNDDAPDWALGNFSGVWGLNFLGFPLPPSGWVEGYYSTWGLGQIQGTYGNYNQDNYFEIQGTMLWIFMFGFIRDPQTGNGTAFTGLGGIKAETQEFYYRLNGIIGPTFYMLGNYTPFETVEEEQEEKPDQEEPNVKLNLREINKLLNFNNIKKDKTLFSFISKEDINNVKSKIKEI